MKKEIIVFTYGDASKASTWSNIPYYLTGELENAGYIVHRVNTRKFDYLQRIINKCIRTVFRKSCVETTYFKTTRLIVNAIMKKSIKKYPNAICHIATNFSYSPASVSNVKSIMLCDWTVDYLIRHFKGRKPRYFERREITRQNKEIEKTDYVITLFPKICEDMNKIYNNNNILYLGNVINMDREEIRNVDLDLKADSTELLFIGQKKYIDSAKMIIQALDSYNKGEKAVTLNIIGMNENEFGGIKIPDYVKFHGYLNKSVNAEREKYYNLLKSAKCCINTSSEWAGFSSIIEALYCYTPIITAKYDEFVLTFGETISFGTYCKNEAEEIINKLDSMYNMDNEEYKSMCKKAHNSVNDYTWSSYIKKMITKCGL